MSDQIKPADGGDRGHSDQEIAELDERLTPETIFKSGHFSKEIPGQFSTEINKLEFFLRMSPDSVD